MVATLVVTTTARTELSSHYVVRLKLKPQCVSTILSLKNI